MGMHQFNTRPADALPPLTTAGAAALAAELGPLTEAHYRDLRHALTIRKPLARAANTARGSAITMLAIAGLGFFVSLIFPSWIGFVMVAGIGLLGAIEYAGAGRLRRGQRDAATFLAKNQLAFLGLITAYCICQSLTAARGGGGLLAVSPEFQAQLAQLQGAGQDLQRQLDFWTPIITYGVYGLVILVSVAAQGGLALYYYTRRRHLADFADFTPPWIQRLIAELAT